MSYSNKMGWPYPAKDSDPWFNVFESMISAMDASAFSSRDDRSLIMSGGGSVSFNATTNALSWSSDIIFFSSMSGFKLNILANSITIQDGEFFYTEVIRSPTGNSPISSIVGINIPGTDSTIAVAVRDGNSVYFRNGAVISDGESKPLFNGGSTVHREIVKLATRESHNSTAPLSVGGDAFNPTDYDKPGYSKTMIFRAVAANGAIGLTNDVVLYNVTDSDTVATLSFTSTSAAKDEIVLVEGSGAGQVDSVEKIYEVRIALGAPPVGPSETIELYGAEIIIVNTPI